MHTIHNGFLHIEHALSIGEVQRPREAAGLAAYAGPTTTPADVLTVRWRVDLIAQTRCFEGPMTNAAPQKTVVEFFPAVR